MLLVSVVHTRNFYRGLGWPSITTRLCFFDVCLLLGFVHFLVVTFVVIVNACLSICCRIVSSVFVFLGDYYGSCNFRGSLSFCDRSHPSHPFRNAWVHEVCRCIYFDYDADTDSCSLLENTLGCLYGDRHCHCCSRGICLGHTCLVGHSCAESDLIDYVTGYCIGFLYDFYRMTLFVYCLSRIWAA